MGTYLRTIGIGPRVGHGKKTGLIMAKFEVFIYKFALNYHAISDNARHIPLNFSPYIDFPPVPINTIKDWSWNIIEESTHHCDE